MTSERRDENRPVSHDTHGAGPDKQVWEEILEISASFPDEVFDRIPADSSAQLDHYVYGVPKRPSHVDPPAPIRDESADS